MRISESSPDAGALLAECARLGLEGIVCSRNRRSNAVNADFR
jgi:hypothetical protein